MSESEGKNSATNRAGITVTAKLFLSAFIACGIAFVAATNFQHMIIWFAVSYGLVSMTLDFMELTKGE